MLTTKNIVVKNKTELFAIQNHEPGEMALCVDTNEIYIWDEEHGWTQINVDTKGFEMNLYDLNKNIISQLSLALPICGSHKRFDFAVRTFPDAHG